MRGFTVHLNLSISTCCTFMILCLIVSVYDVEQKENEMKLLKKQRDTVQYENNILQTRIVSLKSGSKSAKVRYTFCDTLSYIVSSHGTVMLLDNI